MEDYWTKRLADGNALDIGENHWITFFEDGKGNRTGLHDIHLRPDGRHCVGAVTFDIPATADEVYAGRTKWTVNSMEPLDLSPSLLCRSCGDHGWIRQGKWVAA